MNTTPRTAPHSSANRYEITARVLPLETIVVDVQTRVDGVARTMAPMLEDPDRYRVNHVASTCTGTIPYWFQVQYRREQGSTIYTKRDPEVGGHLMHIQAVPTHCSPRGRYFFVDSRADEVDADLEDGECRSASGRCTLRAAIMQANRSRGHDIIQVSAGTYPLTRTGTETMDVPDVGHGDLDVTDAVTIHGASTDLTILDGNAASRLFDLHRLTGDGFVRLERMTLRNGFELERPGGAIVNRTALQLHRVVLRENVLDAGISGSCANSLARTCNRGGALFNEGEVLLTESTLRNNSTCRTTSGTCGGPTGQGGAISNFGSAARLFVERSTIAQNAARFVGGIQNIEGTVLVTNSTLAENTGDWAGAVSTHGGRVGLNSVTIQHRGEAPALSQSGEGELGLMNSVVGIDSGTLCGGVLHASVHNYVGRPFSGDPMVGCTISGNRPAVGTLFLAGLDNNGGPTQTIRISDSTSVGALRPKDAGVVPCPEVDQRGYTRPRDADGDGTARCDAGALEH